MQESGFKSTEAPGMLMSPDAYMASVPAPAFPPFSSSSASSSSFFSPTQHHHIWKEGEESLFIKVTLGEGAGVLPRCCAVGWAQPSSLPQPHFSQICRCTVKSIMKGPASSPVPSLVARPPDQKPNTSEFKIGLGSHSWGESWGVSYSLTCDMQRPRAWNSEVSLASFICCRRAHLKLMLLGPPDLAGSSSQLVVGTYSQTDSLLLFFLFHVPP